MTSVVCWLTALKIQFSIAQNGWSSLIFCVVFLYIVVCCFSFGLCVVRPSPVCGFWLPPLVASNSSYNMWAQGKAGHTTFAQNHRYFPRAIIITVRKGKLETPKGWIETINGRRTSNTEKWETMTNNGP